jgi:hypothetical protein
MSVNVVLPVPTKTELLLTGKSDQDLKRLTSVATFNKIPEPIDLDSKIYKVSTPFQNQHRTAYPVS